MVPEIKTTKNIEDAATFIVYSILKQIQSGKRVLFFVTGGSSIAVASKIAALFERHPYRNNFAKNLTVMMTDERFGPVGHTDSNWHQLAQKGFNIPGAKLLPILTGESRDETTKKFAENLSEEFKNAQYKIGLFGIGADGHTAGILPHSGAAHSLDLAYSYETPAFSRITVTPKAIEKLDEIVVWVQGKEKWKVLSDLENNIDVAKQPAQILKKVSLLTIFTDYNKK